MAASAASIVTGEQHRLSELDKILDSKVCHPGHLSRIGGLGALWVCVCGCVGGVVILVVSDP